MKVWCQSRLRFNYLNYYTMLMRVLSVITIVCYLEHNDGVYYVQLINYYEHEISCY